MAYAQGMGKVSWVSGAENGLKVSGRPQSRPSQVNESRGSAPAPSPCERPGHQGARRSGVPAGIDVWEDLLESGKGVFVGIFRKGNK